MPAAIKIETFPNEYVRVYHFRREATPELQERVRSHLGVENADCYGKRYYIQVVRAHCYTWEEIEPGILFEIDAHEQIGKME